MTGKLNEQTRGTLQSGGKISTRKRRPFADITNIFDSGPGLRTEVSFPPSRSPTLSEMATHRESGSDATEDRNCLAEALAPLKNRQSFLPRLSSHPTIPIPSPLHGAGSSSRIGYVSSVPPVPLPSSLSHLRVESHETKLSWRRVSFDARAQYSSDPDLCVDHTVNDVLPHDPPAVEIPLLSPSPSRGLFTREPLSTSLLPSKTHKLAHGQLVILPSRSVLVDFRELERRKGRKGDEVMVVSPNGDQIRLFSAPHLSTPCCLAEPIVTHSLNDLPADWYKLYEQAKKVIEHVKRNIPKFVKYEDTFICTLMANEPLADVEVRTSPRLTTAAVSTRTTIAIRIRFSRKLRTMQIISNGPRQCNKSMFCTARGVPADAGDWASLSSYEKECLAVLLDFLRTVEAVEGVSRNSSEPSSAPVTERPSKQPTKGETRSVATTVVPRLESDESPPKDNLPPKSAASASAPSTVTPPSTRSIQLTVSPRPRFPSALPRATSDSFRKASSTAVSDAPPPANSPSSLADRVQGTGPLSDVTGPRLQTRFMPGVGWCLRSGGARYRIMFTDGVALEIDVDEEWIEMVEHDGSITKSYTVRDCSMSRKVGDRMKVFREFLPLFDESDC